MNKIMQWLRQEQVWGFMLSLGVILIVSLAFFAPDNFDGNTLRQADMQQGAANGQEALEYFQQTGEKALWTNSLFGGMPTFQISPEYPSNSLFKWLGDVYGLWLPAPSNLLFMMMTGFLILLFALGMRWYYALIGAIAWGLSSYFVIIIGAGHIWKFVTLSYIPPTIAGLVLTYRGRYIAGAAMTAIFAMLQLNANHPQMTYYFAFVMFALVIAWLVEAIRTKAVKRWAIASAVTLGAGALAIGANLPSLYNTYEYSKETKRAQSELTPLPSDDNSEPAEKPTGGMPYSQIVGWSYGKSETFSLVVPNIKGGASARPEAGNMAYASLDLLDDAMEYRDEPVSGLLPYLTQYFNDSEGTNGPVYVGAIIAALFLLGCIIVKGPVKWALAIMTFLSILLAWGANFTALTDFMIYHFPMYNKFRAVESILVIAEFTMPLLAILALATIASDKENRSKYIKPTAIAFGICGLIALAAAVAPSVYGEAITSSDRATASHIMEQINQMGIQQGASPAEIQAYAYQYSLSNPDNVRAVEDLRYGLVKADGWRSLIFIVLGGGALLLFLQGRLRRVVALATVGVLVLVDLYGVDKRYVSHSSFTTAKADEPMFTPDRLDTEINQDQSIYRVIDIPGFYKADRSYFHKMVGGYHAAKLNRYEDLIQRTLNPVIYYGYSPELREDSVLAQLDGDQRYIAGRLNTGYRVLDMLNTKYIITGDPGTPLIVNPNALGNAWLVGKVDYVDNADAEMAALMNLDPARQAVADKKFAPILGTETTTISPDDTIELTTYTPNRLHYLCDTKVDATAVFSEVWFSWGWKVTIDGKPAELARVNYVLRALHVPAGNHEIDMVFDPESLHVTSNIAYASISLIYLLVLLTIFIGYRRQAVKKEE